METDVILTDDEMAVLDGKCRPEIQKDVDAAKARIAASKGRDDPELWRLIADLKTKAEQDGRLGFSYRKGRGKCRVCGKGGGYHEWTRNSRNHRKGAPRYDRPKTTYSVDLNPSCVSVEGHISLGCCQECFNKHNPEIADALRECRAEIPKAITGEEPRFRSYMKYKCSKCGWVGHEGEMRKLPAVFGGYYPGGCPKCNAENLPFGGRVVKLLHEREVVAVRKEVPK